MQTLGVDIDKNVVHRVLAKRYRPTSVGTGPSWLTLIGHATDRLWSVDLFRCLLVHPTRGLTNESVAEIVQCGEGIRCRTSSRSFQPLFNPAPV
jgi:hypothetical protein